MIGIYKIENLINGHIYIGQSINIKRRFNEYSYKPFYPKSEQYNTPLYKAIRKYGTKNFSFNIIETCSKELLNEREIYWIEYYHSYIKDKKGGYNLTRGGDGRFSIIHDIILDSWDKGKSITEISKEFNISKSSVINHLQEYEHYSQEESRRRGYNVLKQRTIKMYDLGFNLLKEFPNAEEAAKEVNLSIGAIKNCCTHRTSICQGKYIFCYDNEKPEDFFKKTRVAQYDMDFNLIKVFLTARQAGIETHHNEKKIRECCRKKIPSYAGYHWEYLENKDNNK